MPTDPRHDLADEALAIAYARDPAGDAGRAALATLVERWNGRVYVWAYRVLRDRDRALDVSQDCFVRVIQALPRYEPRGTFAAWLFTIVHNRCRSAVRRTLWVRDPEVDTDSLAAGAPEPDEAYASAEARGRIAAAMASALDDRERLALWLRAAEGMSVDDITRMLGLDTASGARGLLQTARRKLRAALDPAPSHRDGRP